MVQQLELLPPKNLRESAKSVDEERSRILRELTQSEGARFIEKAKEFVLRYLGDQIQAPGEEITDACKAAGIVPANDKAFGCVYLSLSRQGKIEKAGTCERRKGHGTAGGIIWRIRQ